jgi:predicted enzyme related to lactoylglutathione lyase
LGTSINISHITYRVWDLDRCAEFFTKTLGFYEQRRGNILYLGIGDTLIELGAAEEGEAAKQQDPNRYVFGVAVENLEELVESLVASGVKVVKPLWSAMSFWGKQAVIDTPGGPQIALREWRAPDGPHFADWHPEESS